MLPNQGDFSGKEGSGWSLSQAPIWLPGRAVCREPAAIEPSRLVGMGDDDVADRFPDGLGVRRKRRVTGKMALM